MPVYSMPPTAATNALVPILTVLSLPRHSRACIQRLSTSSRNCRRRAVEEVVRTKESSVSRFAEREFRFVDPNTVR